MSSNHFSKIFKNTENIYHYLNYNGVFLPSQMCCNTTYLVGIINGENKFVLRKNVEIDSEFVPKFTVDKM